MGSFAQTICFCLGYIQPTVHSFEVLSGGFANNGATPSSLHILRKIMIEILNLFS